MSDQDAPRPSDSMTEAELMGMDLECPDCGKQGERTERVHIASAILQMIEGLDLAGCEGCRRVLAAQGGVPIGSVEEEGPFSFGGVQTP